MNELVSLFTDPVTLVNVFFKGFAILGSFIYVLYALIVVRQTHTMLRSINEGNEFAIRLISYVQLALSAVLLFIAVFFV
jgi:mannose/fructose/N-acetylgalactosamine-specific phosphotransferase system component IIC